MAISSTEVGVGFGIQSKSTRNVSSYSVSSFPEAVQTALSVVDSRTPIDVINLDLDKTYLESALDVVTGGLPLTRRGRERQRERMEALDTLLREQKAKQLVIWSARPWVSKRLLKEISTIAQSNGTEVSNISGLGKLRRHHQAFEGHMANAVANGSERILVFGNSRREERGAEWIGHTLGVPVHNFSIKRRPF